MLASVSFAHEDRPSLSFPEGTQGIAIGPGVAFVTAKDPHALVDLRRRASAPNVPPIITEGPSGAAVMLRGGLWRCEELADGLAAAGCGLL